MIRWEFLDTKKDAGLRWRCLGEDCQTSCCVNFFLIHVPVAEVPHLSRYFPVVVTLRQTERGSVASFSAVLRLREDERGCIYLKEEGCSLKEERPFFCKAYPFSVVPANGKNLVAIDRSCPGFSEEEGENLFAEPGKLNEVFDRDFLSYANLIKEDAEKNGVLLEEILNNKLLTGGRFIYKLGDNEQKEIPFNFVDERKLLDLPRDKIKSLAEKGFMSVIYAHLNSLQNFTRLLKAYTERRI